MSDKHPIFEKLKELAPSVVFTVSRTLDPHVSWDGNPEDDPREKGMSPYDVDFKARTIVNGDLIEQMESIGASWYDPEEPIGDAHGYLLHKLEDAANGLRDQLMNSALGMKPKLFRELHGQLWKAIACLKTARWRKS